MADGADDYVHSLVSAHLWHWSDTLVSVDYVAIGRQESALPLFSCSLLVDMYYLISCSRLEGARDDCCSAQAVGDWTAVKQYSRPLVHSFFTSRLPSCDGRRLGIQHSI